MALLNDLTLGQIFTRLAAYLVIIAVHGFALAGLARLVGDRTPQYAGRLSLTPLPHLAIPAMLMAVLFQLFWIAPMRVKWENLRFGRWGLVLVALGALLVPLLLIPALRALAPLVLTALPRRNAVGVLVVFDEIVDMSLWFVALNWLPLPLLTGSLFAEAALPSVRQLFERYRNVALGILIAAIVAGIVEPLIAPMAEALGSLIVL